MSSQSLGEKLGSFPSLKKRKKLNLTTKKCFCLFLQSHLLKHLPFLCNENHPNSFTESIWDTEGSMTAELSRFISFCSWEQACLMFAFLILQNSNSQAFLKKIVQKNFQPRYSRGTACKDTFGTFYQNPFFTFTWVHFKPSEDHFWQPGEEGKHSHSNLPSL